MLSAFDGAQYRLMEFSAGGVRALPIAPRAVPFGAAVGPDRDGVATVVCSRRAKEEIQPVPGRQSRARLALGCDVSKLRLTDSAERRVLAISRRSE